MRALLLAGLLALGIASAARAEIFKCHGPNGDVRFTSDATQCPNAVKHEPDAQAVQRAEPTEAPLVSARPGALAKPKRSPAKAAETTAGSETRWRQKKRSAQARQRELSGCFGTSRSPTKSTAAIFDVAAALALPKGSGSRYANGISCEMGKRLYRV